MKNKQELLVEQLGEDTMIMIQADPVDSTTEIRNKKLFQIVFPDIDITDLKGEIRVISPFPRSYTKNGTPIHEKVASASVNVDKWLFYDAGMQTDSGEIGSGMSMEQLFQETRNIPKHKILAKHVEHICNPLLELAKITPKIEHYQQVTIFEKDHINKLQKYHISPQVATDMKLHISGTYYDELFTIPVIYYDNVWDTRTYRPGGHPKVLSLKGAKTGLVVGLNQWQRDLEKNPVTWICAGEKDMLAMRSIGMNAVCFTGGESTLPRDEAFHFKGHTVVVAYDNDEVGRRGGEKVAMLLHNEGAYVYNFTAHHQDIACKDLKGGDLWDFIDYYRGESKARLEAYLDEMELFSQKDITSLLQREYPFISLNEAGASENIGRLATCTIQPLNEVENIFAIPSDFSWKKETDVPGNMKEGEVLSWSLDMVSYSNPQDIFKLKTEDVKIFNEMKKLCGVLKSELDVFLTAPFKKIDRVSIYQTSVINYRISAIETTRSTEVGATTFFDQQMTAYVIGKQLHAGQKYSIVYQYIPDPTNKQKAVIVIWQANEMDDIKSFKLDGYSKNVLKVLQFPHLDRDPKISPVKAVQQKIMKHYAQDLAGMKEFNNVYLWLVTNLVFTAPLKILLDEKIVRSYLDVIAIGESRSGKSLCAEYCVNKYKVGKVVDAGGATEIALVGGTAKTNNGNSVRYGKLPRENGGLVVLEEVKDLAFDFFKKVRSARSSQLLKITRIDGDLQTELWVRQLYLSNPKVFGNSRIDLRNNFSDGLEVVNTIIGAEEDVNRFDIIFLVDNPAKLEYKWPTPDPETYQYATQFPADYYPTLARWIWTRNPDQFIISPEVRKYARQKAKEFKEAVDGLANVYNTEAFIKIIRIATSLASMLVSTDDNFENIIVKKEHIDFTVYFLKQIYLNDLFQWEDKMARDKLMVYASDADIEAMVSLGNSIEAGNIIVPRTLLEILSKNTREGISKMDLANGAMARRNDDYFENFLSVLRMHNLIAIGKRGYIEPTPKFKEAYRLYLARIKNQATKKPQPMNTLAKEVLKHD